MDNDCVLTDSIERFAMEKIVCLLNVKQPPERLLEFVRTEVLPPLKKIKANSIHFSISDTIIEPAKSKLVVNESTQFNVYLTFTLSTALEFDSWKAGAEAKAFESVLDQSCSSVRRYTVTESTVIDVMDTTDETASAKGSGDVVRLPGWQQVVSITIPDFLTREQWLEIWLHSHSDIACVTQDTFGYIQNIVQRPLKGTTKDIDAIVSENFTELAMTSDEAFYDSMGDPDKLKKHQTAMMESCARFIDMSQITVVPMSAYACLLS